MVRLYHVEPLTSNFVFFPEVAIPVSLESFGYIPSSNVAVLLAVAPKKKAAELAGIVSVPYPNLPKTCPTSWAAVAEMSLAQ